MTFGKPGLNGSHPSPARDGNGNFARGNCGGPGRPRKEVERAYLDRLRALVPMAEWSKVVRRALKDAKAGDAKARDWLSRHLVGDDPVALMEVLDRVAELEARL